MNLLVEAQMDEQRNLAARKISPEVRKRPKLWVEGKDDVLALTHYWQCEFPMGFDIDIFPISKLSDRAFVGKPGVIKKTMFEGCTAFGLVDMDYDFASKEIDTRTLWDTSPKVALNSYFLTGSVEKEERFTSLVTEICRSFADKISAESLTEIKQFTRALTFIKLFKGQNGISDENWGGYAWGDIDYSVDDLNVFIGGLHFEEYNAKRFMHFLQENKNYLSQCGLNDHMLARSICLYLKEATKADISIRNVEDSFRIYRLNQSMPRFIEKLRLKIKKKFHTREN